MKIFFKIALSIGLSFGSSQAQEFNNVEAAATLKQCLEKNTTCQAVADSLTKLAKRSLKDSALADFYIKCSYSYFRTGNFNQSKALLTHATAIGQSLKDTLLLADCYARLGLNQMYEGKLDSALNYINRACRIYEKKGDSLLLGRTVLNRGQILKEKGQYAEALNNYLQSLAIFRALGLKRYQGNVLTEIATLYAMSNENDKAIAFGRKAAALFKSLPNGMSQYAYASLNLANNLSYANFPDSAIALLQEVIPIFIANGDRYLEMNARAQLSNAFYKKGQLEIAVFKMKEAISLDPKLNYPSQAIYNFQLLGRIYQEQNNLNLALENYKRSYRLHQKIGFNDELKTLVSDMASIYERLNNSDSALKYYQEYMIVSDSLFSQKNQAQLNKLKAEYETELQQEQLRNSQQEIVLLEKSNVAQAQRNWALVFILIVVLALTIAIISRQRNSLRLNKIVGAQKEQTHQAQLQIKDEEELRLKTALEHGKRELANQALLIAEKNEMLRSFRTEVENVGETEAGLNRKLQSLSRKMERAENQQSDWDKFMHLFENVHPQLIERLSQLNAKLTHNDLRLLALMRMGFSNKEIAAILHITDDGLKKARYRLRKKLNHESASSLHQFIQTF